MWLIEYQYKREDGILVHIKSPIRDGQPVTIGRSNQCLLHIKNDKSISRKHIQFECERLGETFKVENFGKVTAYDSHYLKVGQKLELAIKDIRKPLKFSLGTSPVDVNILNLDYLLIIPEPINYDVQQMLDDFFIELTTDPISNANPFAYVVGDKNASPLIYLYASILKLPLVTGQFIEDLVNGLRNNCSNMDTLLTQILNQNQLTNPVRASSVKNVMFIYLNKDNDCEKTLTTKLSTILMKMDSDFMVYENDEAFESYLQLRNSLDNVVMIRHEERALNKKILEILGQQTKIFTTSELLKELRQKPLNQITIKKIVLNHNVETELINKSKPIESPKTIESNGKKSRVLEEPIEPSPVPTKKKRLTRRKIQPLNPLELFAGGSQPNINAGVQLDTLQKSSSPPTFEKEKSKSVETDLKENVKVNSHVSSTETKKTASVTTPKNSRFNIERENDSQKDNETIPSRNTPLFLDRKMNSMRQDHRVNQRSLDSNKDFVICSMDDKQDTYKKSNPIENRIASQNDDDRSLDVNENKKRRLDSIVKEADKPTNIETDSEISKQTKRRKTSTMKDQKDKNSKEIKREDGIMVRKPTLVETIQSTKNREIDRFHNTMVQVAPEELTEDAINEFSALSIVETNSTLLRSKPQDKNDNGDSKYKNRPNFKKFIKRRAGGSSNNTESLKRSVDMLTRQFIETKPYSTTDKYKLKNSGDVEEIFAQRESVKKSNNGKSTNQNEYEDNDEGISISNVEDVESVKPKETRSLFHNSDGEEYSDEEHMGAKTLKNNYMHTAELFVESSGEEDNRQIDIPPKNKKSRELFHSSSGIEEEEVGDNSVMGNSIIDTIRDQPIEKGRYSSNNPRPYMSLGNSVDESDDDDSDSDEGPKFQFKSRNK